jgi:hypothetical protein
MHSVRDNNYKEIKYLLKNILFKKLNTLYFVHYLSAIKIGIKSLQTQRYSLNHVIK